MKVYVLTLKWRPWLLPAVEEALRNLSAHDVEDVSKIVRTFRAPNGQPLSDGDGLVALNALADLGVICRKGSRYAFDPKKFVETEELRSGIQAALQILDQERSSDAQDANLCVSLPPALSAAAGHVIHESSMDLRSSLLDVIVSAQKSLIVASPFWDVGATADLVDLVLRKLAAGTRVTILGRFSHELPAEVRNQLSKVSRDPSCAILSWYEGTGIETQTFHFKAISADNGERGYVGSANMTVSSLRSRMELGVILRGKIAKELDSVLKVVLAKASPVKIE